MPLYEYYCPPCSTQFEILRPISKVDEPAVCPSGHTTNNRVLSMFATFTKGNLKDAVPVTTPHTLQGDTCCGGGGGCSC
jgi:putative FmdB family regulatory protein